MVFSSLTFLFLFLPLTLAGYYSAPPRFRNLILLAASLFFYAWGEVVYVLLMLFSILSNYLFGLWIDKAKLAGHRAGIPLALGIALNLLPLAFFKYANFIADNLSVVTTMMGVGEISLDPIHLPIGISFFTFQAISYIVDVYRNQAEVQTRPASLALYIALFPQLIAGPIVRYRDVAAQISKRTVLLSDFHYGVQRFIIGLGKKVLIANTVGAVADHIFSLPSSGLPASLLWLGMLCYTLQIYYDFSGYSDMAIGLGRMFGFRFLENFTHPYCAQSIQDFWRRWHISLSSWFRDYLYIPLGGNRKGGVWTYFNLLTVFFLCGLWHGASWTFIVWGLYHGLFLVVERLGLGQVLARLPRILRHAYTIAVFSVGWVFFRAETLTDAIAYLKGLFSFSAPPYLDAQLFAALNIEFYMALVIGILLSFPLAPWVAEKLQQAETTLSSGRKTLVTGVRGFATTAWIVIVITYSSAQLISGTHNPFLYFRF